MELQPNQSLISGEIVIDTPIIIDNRSVIENKDALKKCPYCHTGTGRDFYRNTDEESGQSEIGFACGSCSKQWSLRFKNPFLFIQI